MASIWKGSIAFGLVNIPVELKSAVRSDSISFRLLHAEDLSPVRYERVCQQEGESVPWNEIVKGYEYAKRKFIVISDEDFKTAAIESSKTIDILDFVKQEEIDPRFFETPYYLVPSKGGEKPYALLREAIRRTGTVGVGKIIIRQSQHLAALKVLGDALVLEIMRFANELVDTGDFSFPSAETVRPQEVQMAEQLIASLADHFDPEKYTDDYRANLMKIIRAKMKGKKIESEAPEAEPADSHVIDLMSRLRQSLEQGKRGRKGAIRANEDGDAAKERSPGQRKRRKQSA